MQNRNIFKEKILLTGGAGYIGVVVLEKLIKNKYKVVVLDNFLFGKEPIKKFYKKIEILHKDIRKIILKDLEGIDAVIHLAGLSNDPMAEFSPKENIDINFNGTKHLAKLCKQIGIKKFIFASSASLYDLGNIKTIKILNESSRIRPKRTYSKSKYLAENYLLKIADENFTPIIFRQGTVYGFSPRMRYDLVVNSMVKTALSQNKIYVFNKGRQWRPLIDVDDIAEAYLKVLKVPAKKIRFQIINLFYKNYRILEVAGLVKKAVEKNTKNKIQLVIDNSVKKDRSYRISNLKLKKFLNWHPKINIESSVKNMIDKIKKYGFTDYKSPKYYNIDWIKLRNKKP